MIGFKIWPRPQHKKDLKFPAFVKDLGSFWNHSVQRLWYSFFYPANHTTSAGCNMSANFDLTSADVWHRAWSKKMTGFSMLLRKMWGTSIRWMNDSQIVLESNVTFFLFVWWYKILSGVFRGTIINAGSLKPSALQQRQK